MAVIQDHSFKEEMSGFGRAVVRLALLMILILRPPMICADSQLEYEVEAAFLLNFTRFTEWHATAFAGPDSPINVCILGKDPFGRAIDEIVQGESVNRRKVAVRRIETAPEPKSCQLVYISNRVRDTPKFLADVGRDVLTVGEGSPFVAEGGMIAFVVDGGRVRFLVNQAAAEAAGLKLSSRLLSVAKAVRK